MLVKLVGMSAIVLSAFAFQSNDEIINSTNKTIVNDIDGKIEWDSESISVGDIEKGIPINIEFEFKNVGKTPVIVSNVKAGCGCTNVDFPKRSIGPGETSSVTAIYNAKTPGKFSKSISVSSNASAIPFELKFNGNVVTE